MVKKIVVAGCRNYENYEEAKKHIEACIQELKSRYDLLFLSGGCKGADRLGEQYAKENGFPVEVFSADWKKTQVLHLRIKHLHQSQKRGESYLGFH